MELNYNPPRIILCYLFISHRNCSIYMFIWYIYFSNKYKRKLGFDFAITFLFLTCVLYITCITQWILESIELFQESLCFFNYLTVNAYDYWTSFGRRAFTIHALLFTVMQMTAKCINVCCIFCKCLDLQMSFWFLSWSSSTTIIENRCLFLLIFELTILIKVLPECQYTYKKLFKMNCYYVIF